MELFLFFLVLIGIIIASIQDLRKREVENSINFFLLIFLWVFVIFKTVFDWDFNYLLIGGVCFLTCLALGNLFYYGRVFAGGDAKLLIAIFAIFISFTIKESLYNILLFCIFLMFSGSIYGLAYTLYFYFRDFSKVNKDFKKEIRNKYLLGGIIFGLVLFLLGYFNFILIVFSLFLIFSCILFAFSKSIEKVSMTKRINPVDLREGDWLAQDIKVKGKVVSYNWEGLTLKQIKLLKKLKNKIKIKEGIAFVPAFLIAVILYFFKEMIISWIFSLV